MNSLSKDAIIMHPLPRVDEVISCLTRMVTFELQLSTLTRFDNRS